MPGLSQDQMGDARRCQSDAYSSYALPAFGVVFANDNVTELTTGFAVKLNVLSPGRTITTELYFESVFVPSVRVSVMVLGPCVAANVSEHVVVVHGVFALVYDGLLAPIGVTLTAIWVLEVETY